MASLQDDGNAKSSKGKNKTTLGFIATAFTLVAASLFAVIGTASNFAASAQLPDGTQQPSTNNTTTASQDNQDLTTVDPMEKAREASGAVIGVLIFYERAVGATGIDPARITDPDVVIPDVIISEIPLGRVQGVLAQNDTGRTGGDPQETLAGNTTGTFGTGVDIVSPADNLVARALAAKAIESLSEASTSEEVRADPLALERLAETQQNLSTLLGIIEGRLHTT